MRTVEIFKTNVHDISDAIRVQHGLKTIDPSLRINFDLDDCDRILRVEGENPDVKFIEEHLRQQGFSCEVLD